MRLFQSDAAFFLDPAPLTAQELESKPVYKLDGKRYREAITPDGMIALKDQGSAEKTERMVGRLRQIAEALGIPFEVEGGAQAQIASRRELVSARYKLGVELKNGDAKHEQRFAAYAAVVNNAMERPLRPQQMRDSFFMCAMGRAGNFSVPGSGKTASALGVYAFLAAKGLVKRVIVVCPMNAFESWRNEFVACFGARLPLREYNVQAAKAKNKSRNDKIRSMRVNGVGCNLVLINYESLDTYTDPVRELIRDGALLVFDEVHRVKRIDGQRANSALEIAKESKYTLVMTGTPIPNGYRDIYNFLNILYPQEYNEFFGFNLRKLNNPSQAQMEDINAKIQPFFVRTTKDDLGVPRPNPDAIISVDADPLTEEILDVLGMRYRKDFLTLFLRTMQLESDPRLLLRDLDTAEYAWLLNRDSETGNVDYVDYSADIVDMIKSAPPSPKFQACIDRAVELVSAGKPCIIWCVFIDSINRIAKALTRRGVRAEVVFGETDQAGREATLDAFRAGKIDVIVTNPQTLAESVSLHSVCHDAIYFEYGFNLVHLLQSKDRIHRLGLAQDQYTQYYFLDQHYGNFHEDRSVDEKTYQRLQEKERIMLEAIADQQLEAMPTDEDDLAAIFEGMFS